MQALEVAARYSVYPGMLEHVPRSDEQFPIIGGRLLPDSGPSRRGSHRLGTLLKCPQLFAYLHELKISLPRTTALTRGSLVHVGIAAVCCRMRAKRHGQNPDAYWSAADSVILAAYFMDTDPRRNAASVRAADLVEEAIAAAEAYARMFASFDTMNIIAVEQELAAQVPANGWNFDPATTSWLFTQRADLIYELDGLYYILDHKTRTSLRPGTHDAYSRDGQFQGYHMFGRGLWGDRFGGVFIRYATLQKKISFQTEVVDYLPWRAQAFVDTIRHAERVREDLIQRGINPWHWPKVSVGNGSCEHRYGPCEAAWLCDHGPEALTRPKIRDVER